MAPGVGGAELIVLTIVALIVVGPKDLPRLMRMVSQGRAKLMSLAGDLRSSFEEMGRQAELRELRSEVESLRNGSLSELSQSLPRPAEIERDLRSRLDTIGADMHQDMIAIADPASADTDPAPECEAQSRDDGQDASSAEQGSPPAAPPAPPPARASAEAEFGI